MNTVDLIIPDLFLPQELAKHVCMGLHLPAMEKFLAKGTPVGTSRTEVDSLEGSLCELFGIVRSDGVQPANAPIAAVSARFDSLGDGYWMRADPVHLHLDQSRMLLSGVSPSLEDAAAFCASLNEHFAGQGMEFFAPHPQRWYVRLDNPPEISSSPLSRVIGNDVRELLPTGEDSPHWHGVFNEIQMLLYSHPANDAREMRGELPVNSVWLWGCGGTKGLSMKSDFDAVNSDDILAKIFSSASGVAFTAWPEQWRQTQGRQLLVWTALSNALQRGDLDAWRAALQDFETSYAQPLWQALRAGKIHQIEIYVPGVMNRMHMRLSRAGTWAFWRRTKPFADYSMV